MSELRKGIPPNVSYHAASFTVMRAGTDIILLATLFVEVSYHRLNYMDICVIIDNNLPLEARYTHHFAQRYSDHITGFWNPLRNQACCWITKMRLWAQRLLPQRRNTAHCKSEAYIGTSCGNPSQKGDIVLSVISQRSSKPGIGISMPS